MYNGYITNLTALEVSVLTKTISYYVTGLQTQTDPQLQTESANLTKTAYSTHFIKQNPSAVLIILTLWYNLQIYSVFCGHFSFE